MRSYAALARVKVELLSATMALYPRRLLVQFSGTLTRDKSESYEFYMNTNRSFILFTERLNRQPQKVGRRVIGKRSVLVVNYFRIVAPLSPKTDNHNSLVALLPKKLARVLDATWLFELPQLTLNFRLSLFAFGLF